MSCLSVPVAEDGQPEHGRGSYVYGYGFDELVASMPSMAGKTIAVTGSTSGTGYVLAMAGWRVEVRKCQAQSARNPTFREGGR